MLPERQRLPWNTSRDYLRLSQAERERKEREAKSIQ